MLYKGLAGYCSLIYYHFSFGEPSLFAKSANGEPGTLKFATLTIDYLRFCILHYYLQNIKKQAALFRFLPLPCRFTFV